MSASFYIINVLHSLLFANCNMFLKTEFRTFYIDGKPMICLLFKAFDRHATKRLAAVISVTMIMKEWKHKLSHSLRNNIKIFIEFIGGLDNADYRRNH